MFKNKDLNLKSQIYLVHQNDELFSYISMNLTHAYNKFFELDFNMGFLLKIKLTATDGIKMVKPSGSLYI